MKKITAAVLTAIMLCSLMAVATPGTASAEPFTPLAGDVYYFTDNPNYLTNVNYIVNNTSYTSSRIHTIYYNYNGNATPSYERALYENLTDLFIYESFDDFSYSYVIFEWYDELVLGDLDGDNNVDNDPDDDILKNAFFADLTSMFSTFKQNGNYVMFISSTDQCRFYYNRGFLNYVDFHVDTDIYYNFASSVIYYMEEMNSFDPIDNVNIVFGQGFIDYNYYGTNFMESYFMKMYFAPYIEDNLTYYSCGLFEDVFIDTYFNNNDAPLHLLFETASGTYYDPFNNVTQYYYDTNVYDGDWVFITASYNSDYVTCSRMENMYDFANDNGLTSNIFYYDTSYYPLYYLVSAEPYVSTPAIYHTPSVQFLMKEYVTNEDLDIAYNNWSGVCGITYKMVDVGDDGWMIGGIVKGCWQNGPIHIEINIQSE